MNGDGDRITPVLNPRSRFKEWLAILASGLVILGGLFGVLAWYVGATVQAATLLEREHGMQMAHEVAKAETRGLASEVTAARQAEQLSAVNVTLRRIEDRLAKIEEKVNRR